MEIIDAGEGFTGIVLEKDGERLECLLASDMELNEPGFIFIQQPPKRKRQRRCRS